MRIVEAHKKKITFEEIGTKLGMEVVEVEWHQGRYAKFKCLKKDDSQVNVYLRCDDLKNLLDVKFNILDVDAQVKGTSLEYYHEEEVYRGKLSKWMKKFKR